MLTQLIKQEIDGKPVQGKIVSAILMGTSLQVPPGKDVGGDFKAIPLCRAKSQTGCVIAYASFRADSPPPANSRFGKGAGRHGLLLREPGRARRRRGDAAQLLEFRRQHRHRRQRRPAALDQGRARRSTTPFVATPGLVTAKCVSDADGDLPRHHHPSGRRQAGQRHHRRRDQGGVVQKDWGLHLIDANLEMGDIVDLVGAEEAAYLAKR